MIYRKLDRPGLFEGLKANTQGLKYVKDWLKGKKNPWLLLLLFVTIPSIQEETVTEAWSSFTSYLLEAGYNPIVVPDTDNAFSKKLGFEGIPFFTECARTWVYELHFMRPLFKLFVPNGCMVWPHLTLAAVILP